METLGWVDLALLGALLLSMLIGLWRGLLLEVLALAGWVVAWFGAHWLAPQWAPHLPVGDPGSSLRAAVAFVAAFLAVLIGCGVAARLLRLLLQATPMRGVDRLLGGAFGLLRGVVLLLVITAVVALTPAASAPEWHASRGAQWLGTALQGLKPLLPADVARRLPA
jgi:membrane protein required for colicin V production